MADDGRQRLTSVKISLDDQRRLEQLAREFGFLQSRGPGARRLGNISALMRGIARGEVVLFKAATE